LNNHKSRHSFRNLPRRALHNVVFASLANDVFDANHRPSVRREWRNSEADLVKFSAVVTRNRVAAHSSATITIHAVAAAVNSSANDVFFRQVNRCHGVKLRKRLRLINKNLQQFCNGLEWGRLGQAIYHPSGRQK
jgi:signal recognition particle subunit SEC65